MTLLNIPPKTLLLALAFCSVFTFASCSTGTDSGETNVEDSSAKDVHEKSGTEKNGDGTDDNESGADR